MIRLPVSEFKNEISETLNRVIYGRERVLLQRHGKDVAAIISMKELEMLEKIEEIEDEVDLKEALKVLKRLKAGETELVSWDKAKKELGL